MFEKYDDKWMRGQLNDLDKFSVAFRFSSDDEFIINTAMSYMVYLKELEEEGFDSSNLYNAVISKMFARQDRASILKKCEECLDENTVRDTLYRRNNEFWEIKKLASALNVSAKELDNISLKKIAVEWLEVNRTKKDVARHYLALCDNDFVELIKNGRIH